jgi:hypothetical protein
MKTTWIALRPALCNPDDVLFHLRAPGRLFTPYVIDGFPCIVAQCCEVLDVHKGAFVEFTDSPQYGYTCGACWVIYDRALGGKQP